MKLQTNYNSIKRLISLSVFTLIAAGMAAQHSVQFTNYMNNTLAVNPAYAGSREMLNITVLSRLQWVGIEGAPNSQTFFIHSPLPKEELGIGFSVVNDNIGPVNETNFMGDFSYTIKTSKKGRLAFGVKGGISMLQGNLRDLKTTQAGDQAFAENIQSDISPNFGFGIFYHTPKWYAGASSPKLLENKVGPDGSEIKENRHYYLIAGLILPVNEDLKFKPTILTKMTPNTPLSIDVSAQFLLREKLWLGGMYRVNDAVAALLGFQFTDQLRGGYSYDYTLSKLATYSNGSHELFLSFDFIFKRRRIISPRYF